MPLTFKAETADDDPAYMSIAADALDTWMQSQSPDQVASWVNRRRDFPDALAQYAPVVPDQRWWHCHGIGRVRDRCGAVTRSRFHLAAAATNLPEGSYRLEGLVADRVMRKRRLDGLLSGLCF